MSKTLTPANEQDRAQRRAADRQFARQAVERLRTSEGWRRWLAARRHFHRYSLINQCLIAAQRPDATRVAGFRRWLALGYAVRKGEKAIRIWVPMRPSRKQIERWESEGADPDRRPRVYFRLGPVFDRSQVQPLPPPAEPVPLDPPLRPIEGEQLAGTLPRLVALAKQIGSEVSFETVRGGALGRYELQSRRITVEAEMPANAQVRTLTHELAHALLRAESQEDDPRLGRAGEELVVESVAYTVCGSLGLDTGGYSIPYLASWSTAEEIEIIERTATLIDRIARRIETAAAEEEHPVTEEPVEGHSG